MDYKVGQILFIVPAGKTKLVPVQVIEEIIKKSLNGTSTSYMIRMNSGEDAKEYDIAHIKGEVFESAQVAKKMLTKRAAESIEKLVDDAVNKATAWYESGFEAIDDEMPLHEQSTTKQEPSRNVNNNSTRVKLPDGTVANINMPDGLEG